MCIRCITPLHLTHTQHTHTHTHTRTYTHTHTNTKHIFSLSLSLPPSRARTHKHKLSLSLSLCIYMFILDLFVSLSLSQTHTHTLRRMPFQRRTHKHATPVTLLPHCTHNDNPDKRCHTQTDRPRADDRRWADEVVLCACHMSLTHGLWTTGPHDPYTHTDRKTDRNRDRHR